MKCFITIIFGVAHGPKQALNQGLNKIEGKSKKNYLLLQFSTDLDKNLSADIYQYQQQICGSRILYCIFILPLSSSQASTEVLAPHEGCAARDDPETELALSYIHTNIDVRDAFSKL